MSEQPTPLAAHFTASISAAYKKKFGKDLSMTFTVSANSQVATNADGSNVNAEEAAYLRAFQEGWDAAGDRMFPKA